MMIRIAASFPGIRFEWKDRKAAENLRKHGVSFQTAALVLDDPSVRIKADHNHSEYEDRVSMKIAIELSVTLARVVYCL